MQFRGVCLITREVRRLREFYEKVLQVKAEGDEIFATFPRIGAVLSIFSEQGTEQMAPGSMHSAGTGSYTLEFEVEDVDGEYERLRALGVPIVKPPTTQPWGLRSVWFRDPDANIVNFFMRVTGEHAE
jgi:catechol 2,3-dioxygenase-like lactoylglutathione lyase family enzyme